MTNSERSPSRFDPLYNPATLSGTSIRGLGLVKHDLSDFTQTPVFNFAASTQILRGTGSRPWCITTPHDSIPWQNVLDEIPADKYMVHMIEASLGNRNLIPVGLKALKNCIRAAAGKPYSDQFTMYKTGDNLLITSEQVHMSVGSTALVMNTIDGWLATQPSER